MKATMNPAQRRLPDRSRHIALLAAVILTACGAPEAATPLGLPPTEPVQPTAQLEGMAGQPTLTATPIASPTLIPTQIPTEPPTQTPTPEPQPGYEVLVGAGDIGWCSSQSRAEETAALLDEIPGTVYTTGDNAYDDGTLQEFNECYDPSWGRHKDRTRPVAGDHEYLTPGASGYFDYFGEAAGEPGEGWYSYDLGAWHIIVLNSNCNEIGGCLEDSPQGRWLKADLEAHPAPCTLAMWHHPRFSTRYAYQDVTETFWQMLYEHGAEVVLNGHDHHYMRFAPQMPDGTADLEQGIRQFTVGTGGRMLYDFEDPATNVEVRDNTAHGVLKLVLHPDRYEWEFIPVEGQVFSDAGSTRCH